MYSDTSINLLLKQALVSDSSGCVMRTGYWNKMDLIHSVERWQPIFLLFVHQRWKYMLLPIIHICQGVWKVVTRTKQQRLQFWALFSFRTYVYLIFIGLTSRTSYTQYVLKSHICSLFICRSLSVLYSELHDGTDVSLMLDPNSYYTYIVVIFS